ncbi:hypothetical protein KPL70_019804 [Citrus sinensis]|nr:hypothetical protein KPL70_019804 [Citrus sinensis]
MHFIDLPHHQRAALRDQEMVRRIIAQMSLEAELHHHLAPTNCNNGGRDRKMSVDSELEEIENEITKLCAELEEVEKQLQYFLKSPSCIKSASEAEFLEGFLEETLKLVYIRKQNLETNNSIQETSNSEKRPMHSQSAAASGFMMGSSNYCLGNWPQQYDAGFLNARNFSNSSQFQHLRNESSQPFAEVFPTALPNLYGTGFPTGNIVSSSSRPEANGYIRQLPRDQFFNNADFSQGMNNIQQGRRAADQHEENKVADATLACRGSCSQYRDRGLPFPY